MILAKNTGRRHGSTSTPSQQVTGRKVGSRRTVWGRARARRVLAALLAAAAVWLGLSAATGDPAGPMTQVVVAADDVATGATLTRDDVVTTTLPQSAVPRLASGAIGEWVGKRVVVPLQGGDVLTQTHVSLPALAEGQPQGQVITHVPLSSAALARAAAPGTRVDVLSAIDGAVLASDVVVLDNGRGASADDREGPGVFVVVDSEQAAKITAQGADSPSAVISGAAVTVVLRP
ncbi:hypothetical protein BH23ACT6_BH23ACT6_17550 [soil metagenome]